MDPAALMGFARFNTDHTDGGRIPDIFPVGPIRTTDGHMGALVSCFVLYVHSAHSCVSVEPMCRARTEIRSHNAAGHDFLLHIPDTCSLDSGGKGAPTKLYAVVK